MKKWLIGLLAAGVLCCVLTACQRRPAGQVQVAVEITRADGEGVHKALVMKGGKTAKDAFEQVCKEEKIAHRITEQGFDGFFGIDADEVDHWVFYVGTQPEKRLPEKYKLQNNDVLAYRYEARK